jgi:hypothetical protein
LILANADTDQNLHPLTNRGMLEPSKVPNVTLLAAQLALGRQQPPAVYLPNACYSWPMFLPRGSIRQVCVAAPFGFT